MVKEATDALGGRTTNVAVRNWILQKYPGTRPGTIACQIIVCTVNHNSRIHFPENQKPRRSNEQYDFLFRPSKGQLEWYDPIRHGSWEIAESENGSLVVRQADTGKLEVDELPAAANDAVVDETKAFAAEFHLRDFLSKNLDVIEDGLQLFVDEEGAVGVEYATDMGRIDILAVDRNGCLLVIELKVDRGPDQVCGQIMRYYSWVKHHLANGKSVRGLIIAKHISDRIRYALSNVPDVSAREYQMNITLLPVAGLGSD